MIKVDETTMRYLELLHFEITGYQNIINKTIAYSRDLERYEVDEKTKEFYLNKFIEKNKEYEMLKAEIIREYVPKEKRKELVEFDFENLTINFVNGRRKC